MKRGLLITAVAFEAPPGPAYYKTRRHVIGRQKSAFDNTENAAVSLVIFENGVEVGRDSTGSPTTELRALIDEWETKNGGPVAS